MKQYLVGAGILLLGGCALIETRPPEEIVGERATERLELLRLGKLTESYELMTPGYRATKTELSYKMAYNGAGMWRNVAVDTVTCSGEPANRCEVVLRITYQMAGMPFDNDRVFNETWLYTERNWYKFEE